MHWVTMTGVRPGRSKLAFPWAEPEAAEPPASFVPSQVVPSPTSQPVRPVLKSGLVSRFCADIAVPPTARTTNITASGRRLVISVPSSPVMLTSLFGDYGTPAFPGLQSGHAAVLASVPIRLRRNDGRGVEGTSSGIPVQAALAQRDPAPHALGPDHRGRPARWPHSHGRELRGRPPQAGRSAVPQRSDQ